MRYNFIYFFLFLITVTILKAQQWEEAESNENIIVYTKESGEDNVKSYRAISKIDHPLKNIYNVYADIDNYYSWFRELENLEVFSKSISAIGDTIIYYSEISIPWPFKNRDMMTKLVIDKSVPNKYVLKSKPTKGKSENDDCVRLTDFYQITTLTDNGDGTTKIEMEGKYNAGGNVPSWLINMFVVSGPTNAVESIQEYLNSKN